MSAIKQLCNFYVIGIYIGVVLTTNVQNNASDEIQQSIEQSHEQTTIEQPEKLLLDHLLKDYERDVLPVTIQNNSLISVLININLKHVDLDVKSHLLFTYAWIVLEWNDQLLRWNPRDFSNLTVIRVPIERIWVPDLELYNSADEDVSLSDGRTPIVLKHDGNCSWIEPKQLRSFCRSDVTYFPFDQHTCKLTIGSWAHDGDKVDLNQKEDTIELDESAYPNLGEWIIQSAVMTQSKNYYSCCSEPYVDVKAILVVQRRSLHYTYSIIIPCLLLSLLLLLIHQLSPDNVLRLGIEILILMVFSFFIWNIISILPPDSASLLLIYLALMMILTFASIVFTVVILKLYQGGIVSGDDSLLLKFLLLVFKDNVQQTANGRIRDGVTENTSFDVTFNNDDVPLTQYSFTESAIVPETGNESPSTSTQNVIKNSKIDDRGMTRKSSTTAMQIRNIDDSIQTSQQTMTPVAGTQVCKESITDNDKAGDKIDLTVEWKLVAQKVDKIGFWCFGLMTMLVNTCVLILAL